MASTSSSKEPEQPTANVQQFVIRCPKNTGKRHHVMRFNANLNVDFNQWRNVTLERENNMKEFRGMDEDMPKFGAGSEYNRDMREEARRKKFGIIARKYRPEAQPYILKVGGKNGKKFKGVREGGVSENAAFYVFTHAPDGTIEAYPLEEWYNFQPIQRYKALSAEEAEHEFGRRKKVMNYFSLMLQKRLKGDEEEEEDLDEVKLKGAAAKKSKELKISEMDEWIDSEDESGSDSEEEKKKKEAEDSDDDGKPKGKKAQDKNKKTKKKRDVNDEAFEESDDGDEEGREMDYDTESSEDEPDPESKGDMKSVAEEDAMRKLLTSDEEDEEDDDDKKSEESGKDDEEKEKEKDKEREKEKTKKSDKNKEDNGKDKKKKSTNNKKQVKEMKKESSSDFSSDSSDYEEETSRGKKPKDFGKTMANINSRSVTPTTFSNDTNKRKLNSMPTDLTASENSNSPMSTPAKKPTADFSNSLPSTFVGVTSTSRDDYGITEEAVRRYLMRKPMTATELLAKFKNKKTGVSSERLLEIMTQILKRINLVKQTIQGKMYLSIKVNK